MTRLLLALLLLSGCGRTVTAPEVIPCVTRTDTIPNIAIVTVTVVSATCRA